MDNNADLIRLMAESFITAVRALETENARLRGEKELLELELREIQNGTDIYIDFGEVGS